MTTVIQTLIKHLGTAIDKVQCINLQNFVFSFFSKLIQYIGAESTFRGASGDENLKIIFMWPNFLDSQQISTEGS